LLTRDFLYFVLFCFVESDESFAQVESTNDFEVVEKRRNKNTNEFKSV